MILALQMPPPRSQYLDLRRLGGVFAIIVSKSSCLEVWDRIL